MRLLMEPVEVDVRQDVPVALRWRRRGYRVVEVAQRWTYRGRWWTDPALAGERRTYFRLRCEPAVHFEVFERAGQWILSRVLD